MATQTKTVEVVGVSGQTTGFAVKRNDDASGVADSVTVSEIAGTGIYTVSINWDDATASNEPLGDWAISVGAATGYLGRSIVTFVDGQDDYALGNVPTPEQNAAAILAAAQLAPIQSDLQKVEGEDVEGVYILSPPVGSYTITATVKTGDTPVPVQNALVQLRDASTNALIDEQYTSSSGSAVPRANAGSYNLDVIKTGYASVRVAVVVAGDTVPADIIITAINASAPPPPASGLCNVTVNAITDRGALQERATVTAKHVSPILINDSLIMETKSKDVLEDGQCVLVLIQGVTYDIEVTGKDSVYKIRFAVPAESEAVATAT